jgi:hypothetical protein
MVSTYWHLRFTILQASKDAEKAAAERDKAAADRDLKAANAAAERDLKAANTAAERDLKAANAAAEREKAAALRALQVDHRLEALTRDVTAIKLDVSRLLQRADSQKQEASSSTTCEPRAPKPQSAEQAQASTATPASAPLGGVARSSALATCHVGSAGLLSGVRPRIRLPGAPSARAFQRRLLTAVCLWK